MDGASIDLYGKADRTPLPASHTHRSTEILEVERGASKDEIRKAYRKVRRHSDSHPV